MSALSVKVGDRGRFYLTKSSKAHPEVKKLVIDVYNRLLLAGILGGERDGIAYSIISIVETKYKDKEVLRQTRQKYKKGMLNVKATPENIRHELECFQWQQELLDPPALIVTET